MGNITKVVYWEKSIRSVAYSVDLQLVSVWLSEAAVGVKLGSILVTLSETLYIVSLYYWNREERVINSQ